MGKTRAEQAQLTKDRIMEAATKLFSKKGFDDVSMQDIAKAANCTAGNIYHYFGSKEELMLHSMDSMDDKYKAFYTRLQTEPEFCDLPASQKLRLFLEEVMKIMSEEKHLTNLYVYALKNPQSGMKLWRDSRVIYKAYHKLAVEMQENGELSQQQDVDVISQQLITLTRGIMITGLISEGQWDVSKASGEFFDVYFRGLLTEAKSK